MTDQDTYNDAALGELNAQLDDLNAVVAQINRLRADNLFRFLSKAARNELMTALMDKSGAVEDAARAAFRALKKNKRQRLPDEIADLLLSGRRDLAIVANPEIIGAPVKTAEEVNE